MNEYNLNALNEDDAEYMTRKYQRQIKDGYLDIMFDPEVTNLRFLEILNIQTLSINMNVINMNVNLRSSALKKITVSNLRDDEGQQQRLNLNVDDLELENLEVLELNDICMNNDQLYNLAKFKKLHTLDVSRNNVDLTHIHSVTSLTKLYMQRCGLRNIDQISSLVNLKELDLSQNRDIDLSPLWQVRSLTKLTMRECGLTNIDQITQLINLEVLNLDYNQRLTINSIGSLVNLKQLDISWNKYIDITPLKDLVGHKIIPQ
ncbi:internalin-A_precursor [Hexamita inflata]|uniref:Internalin-A n=1 Tax=Hexamita inflata TaxID=28002 RepID=A0AA86RUY7_9EUKA|nr:internalin-A precursor [Hexamita inflata]